MSDNAIQVEQWPLARLLPYAENARTHSEEQVSQIAASIAEFGFNNPALVDENGVLIAGHGRLLAAKSLGMETVPVIRLAHLTDTQARAFRLADNQIALNSGWDDELLAAELARLQGEEFDLTLLGFSDEDLERLLAETVEEGGDGSDEDSVPEPPVDPTSNPGDMWLLGKHRLLCGDATVATDVARLLAGDVPHLMVTDPPYGVNYDPSWRTEAGVNNSSRMGKVANDDRADWREAWALFPGDVAYVWHAGLYAASVSDSLTACGFDIRSQIIWAKPRLVLSRGHYHWQHEPCWYAVRSGATGHWHGERDKTTLWAIGTAGDGEDAATVHGTQKPVECMRRPIENNSVRGDTVYEPFCGSGTTLIAAETAGRVCLAMELDPRYCDVIVLRWQALTGRAATLDGDGRSFDDIAGVP